MSFNTPFRLDLANQLQIIWDAIMYKQSSPHENLIESHTATTFPTHTLHVYIMCWSYMIYM